MADEEWKYGSRDQTNHEPAKGGRKARKAKSSGAKSKKKNSRILPQKNTHSTTTSGDLNVNDSRAVDDVEHAGSGDVERPLIEEDIQRDVGAVSRREESPSKRSRSKSRSRSGSRSRFSNFFRRKKKFASETDLVQNTNDEADKRYESGEHIERTDRPQTLDLRGGGVASASTLPMRGNLKRTSPHHSYDSRIQPRDRLLNMTVADAVKEQQLRRANSANRYSPRRRETTSSTSAIMFLSSPSLAAAMIASDAARRAFAATTTSSTLPAMKSKRHSAGDSAGNANSLPRSGFSMNIENGTTASVARKEAQPSSLGGVNIDQDRTHRDTSKSRNLTNSIVEPRKQPHTDRVNDYTADTDSHRIHPTEIKHEALISNLSQNAHSPSSHSSSAHRTPEEEATEARVKRKASLSHFLELRQTLPPILSRAHRLSQSSDSGVTSRDTSPCAHPVHPEVKRRPQEQQPSPPDPDAQWKDKSPNPYVVSSISVTPASITHPNQSTNGEKIQIDLKESEITTNRPTALKLEDSMAESSSMSSSPQINSMSSSFRSSDQGYAETDSEDEASFATPPEEVESTSSIKRGKSGRTFHPSILEKLLETSREHPPREPFQEPDLEFPVAKRQFSNIETEFLEDVQPTQGPLLGEEKGQTKPRYIPRGVRRSQSDADSRNKSSRRIHKRSSKPEDAPQRTGSADGFSTSPDLSREKVTFDLDKLSTHSTVTLTNQDGFELDLLHVERTDQKLVPVMGTVAQQKYRRTYSPSRFRKMIPVSKDENATSPGPHIATSPTKIILVKEVMTPTTAATLQEHPKNDLPEKNSHFPVKKSELSPSMPRKGILKSPMKDKTGVPNQDSKEGLLKLDSNIKPALKPDTSRVNEHLSENKAETLVKTENNIPTCWTADTGEQIVPEIDISEETTPKIETKKATKLKKQKRKEKLPKLDTSKLTTPRLDVTMPTPTVQITFDNSPITDMSNSLLANDSIPNAVASQMQMESAAPSVYPIEKSHSASDIISHTQACSVSEGTTDLSTGSDNNLTIDFPLIHGLEVGLHKVHTFGGYSLTDYLKEQSKANWKQQTSSPKETVAKTPKSSLKKKATPNVESRKQQGGTKLEKKATYELIPQTQEQIPRSTQDAACIEHIVKDSQSNTLKIMVDKECQTSAWLINALVRHKSSKTKKKASSFSKKKKQQLQHRRGSSVSDTFIPTDIKRHKESFQHSSLGDIRLACSREPNFTKQLVRGCSEKGRRVISIAGSSTKSHADNKNDDSPQLPKPKKLSLSAVILLKNRLAKYRERKRNDKPSLETVDDEPCLTRVSSDTLITIENELNLSKFEVSKETDIIDDDFYESDYNMGYAKKLRFVDQPNELMQGEEPLPPLPTSRRMRQRRESTLRERRKKCVQYCKKFIAFLFSHVGLCSLVVAYTILGGFIFQALENQAEYTVRSSIRENREKVVGRLVSLAVEFQKTERGMENFTVEVNSTILEHQANVHRLTKDKGWDGVEGVDEEGLWTFASSLLYAITVTTTIGYGHVAPKTPEGRIVTIGYAVVGIPLTLLCLTNIGDVMATGFRLLYGKICCGVCCTLFKPRRRRLPADLEKGLGGPIVTTEEEQSDKPKEVIHVPTSLCLLLIAGYIFAGAMLFSMWESWDILTGSYFCFITLSTIGFGDIVPGMDSNAWAAEEKLVLCALYLVLGLSLIAMCFNLVQEDVKAKCRWLGMKLGIVEKHETPL